MDSVSSRRRPLPARLRRRIPATHPRSAGCVLHPPIDDEYMTRMLCRSGLRYVRPDCDDDLGTGALKGSKVGERSMGEQAATDGFSIGIGLLLLVLLIILAVWARRRLILKKGLKQVAEADSDVEQPPKSALLHRRRRRRLRRLLHLKQHHVSFSDDVDINEIHSMSEFTSEFTSSSSARVPAKDRYPRPNSPWLPMSFSYSQNSPSSEVTSDEEELADAVQ